MKASQRDEENKLIYDLNNEKGKKLYFESIKETISLGGDTDTNACIVGGMVGAYVGISNIDK